MGFSLGGFSSAPGQCGCCDDLTCGECAVTSDPLLLSWDVGHDCSNANGVLGCRTWETKSVELIYNSSLGIPAWECDEIHYADEEMSDSPSTCRTSVYYRYRVVCGTHPSTGQGEWQLYWRLGWSSGVYLFDWSALIIGWNTFTCSPVYWHRPRVTINDSLGSPVLLQYERTITQP